MCIRDRYRSEPPANAVASPVNIPDTLLRIISERINPIGAASANRDKNMSCVFFLNLLSRKIAASERETGI